MNFLAVRKMLGMIVMDVAGAKRIKADFHLTYFVRAGVALKSEHVMWSRFCVSYERQKVDRVSTFCRSQQMPNRDHLILTKHAQIWALRLSAQKMSNGNRPLVPLYLVSYMSVCGYLCFTWQQLQKLQVNKIK